MRWWQYLGLTLLPLTHANAEIPGYEVFERVAYEHQLDPKAIYAMALAESGHWSDGEFVPHPYAISLGADDKVNQTHHEGFYPESLEEARSMLSQLLSAGYTNIGVGFMQINIGANPGIVDDYLSLLDPETNIKAASKVLGWCRRYDEPEDVFACYSRGSAGSPAGKKYASRVNNYAAEFGQNWEAHGLIHRSGIYSYESFLRVASDRLYSNNLDVSSNQNRPGISIVTQSTSEEL